MAFKPCNTGLDLRIKSKFTAKLMWWPGFARFFYKNFEILSWIFVVLMLLSAVGTGYGLYNYIKYGNCNGPDSSAFCVFNVVHQNQPECSIIGDNAITGTVNAAKVEIGDNPVRGDKDATIVLHEFGCYSCPYTKDAEPIVRKILSKNPDVKLVFHDVPLEIHNFSIEAGKGAICAGEQGKYWDYHDLIFERQESLNNESFDEFALMLDLNITRFDECFSSNKTDIEIKALENEASGAGIYGTPTFVLGNNVLVGPQSYKTFENLIK
jgi:protein-disulfide isomerase